MLRLLDGQGARRFRPGSSWRSALLVGLLCLGAAAQAQSVNIGSIARTGCADSAFSFSVNFVDLGAPTGPWRVRTVVNQGSDVFMDQIWPSPTNPGFNPTGTTTWGVYSQNQGGTVNAAFPMLDNTPFTMTLSVLNPANQVVSSSVTNVSRCGPGAQIVLAPVAVPTLGAGSLAALSGLLGLLGWTVRRRRSV